MGLRKTIDLSSTTAEPGDVRAGETFGSKKGVETGIWTPKVTDFTGDATVTAEDLKRGVVAYGANGRVVGTGEDSMEVNTLRLTRGTAYEKISFGYKICDMFVTKVTSLGTSSAPGQCSIEYWTQKRYDEQGSPSFHTLKDPNSSKLPGYGVGVEGTIFLVEINGNSYRMPFPVGNMKFGVEAVLESDYKTSGGFQNLLVLPEGLALALDMYRGESSITLVEGGDNLGSIQDFVPSRDYEISVYSSKLF